MLNSMFQSLTIFLLFPCYARDVFFSNFLGAYGSCVHPHRPCCALLFNNIPFEPKRLMFFGYSLKDTYVPNKIGIYSPRKICLQRLVAHLVSVFFVDCLFLSWWQNISMELCIFGCVRGCPYSCFITTFSQ